jgi:hypothetical protein
VKYYQNNKLRRGAVYCRSQPISFSEIGVGGRSLRRNQFNEATEQSREISTCLRSDSVQSRMCNKAIKSDAELWY